MIGITYNPSVHLFYSGLNQTAITLAELFIRLQYKVCFIDIGSNTDKWWDYPLIPDIIFKNLNEISGIDLLIDIDGLVLPEYRERISNRSIVFLRNFLQFAELDKSVYPELTYIPRDYTGIHEIWCWDILNPVETLDSVQTFFKCPIKRVPFIWSSSVAEHYKNYEKEEHSELHIHVAEKSDNTSSPIIPLVSIRELKLSNVAYKFHMKPDNKFLEENVIRNIQVEMFPITFEDKEPYYKWTNSILFSHSRFVPIRIGLLNALWLEIPVIHNSPILKDLPVLDTLFYTSNKISEISTVFHQFLENPSVFYDSIADIKQSMLQKWSIPTHVSEWSDIILGVMTEVTSVKVTNVEVTRVEVKKGKEKIIAFIDMWPGFNCSTNFIIDSLHHVKGIAYGTMEPDLVIFGPYSNQWKEIPHSIPKVFFSAENYNGMYAAPEDDSISLFLTSCPIEDDKHIYIPTWITFIDWLSDSKVLEESNDNPIRIPVHFAMTPHPIPFEKREKFCAFVVSNPICNLRNEIFKTVHEYKHVDSGGALYNNIGGQLSLKYPGGGCGDISKYRFFEQHKFTISFENSQSSGYITEKVLHSKMAGCIPIYWGDKDDFVPGSIVNVSNISDPCKILDIIKKLEDNPRLCSKIASLPILNEEKKKKALGIISKMSARLSDLVGINKIHNIDKIFLINLETRRDRLESLMKAEPYLEHIITPVSGINGKTLQMNKMIYDLFKNNQFQWKKSIIGCNLSHISVWNKIANEIGQYFLIIEDDVRFKKDWIRTWNTYAKYIPEDADMLYLGGVLPPNRSILPQCTKQVNEYWSEIIPNTYFSNTPLPIFHFCAYSYILTKKGARKLVDYITNSELKSYTVSDHLLGSTNVGLIKYFTNPLLSYCFQEEDPNYLTSQFNDLHRKDVFDSDIWNNTECFTEEEIQSFRVTICVNESDDFENNLYEKEWFHEIMGPITFRPFDETPHSWFLIHRPIEKYIRHFQLLDSKGIDFNVIHLSDEFCTDDISFYYFPTCKRVIRNYIRADVPPNCITIPLGFHYKPINSKTFTSRKLLWSFHGTDWFHRKDTLSHLSEFLPHNCHLTPTWNDPSMTKEDTYLSTLANSKFCPILRGNNVETFRMYECLEAGSIPIYVRSEGDELYWKFISNIGLMNIETWEKAKEMVRDFINHPDKAEMYRQRIYTNWLQWKLEIKLNTLGSSLFSSSSGFF